MHYNKTFYNIVLARHAKTTAHKPHFKLFNLSYYRIQQAKNTHKSTDYQQYTALSYKYVYQLI